MGNKLPQSPEVIAKRLRRVAKWIDKLVEEDTSIFSDERLRARANTCWQAAAMLTGNMVCASCGYRGDDVHDFQSTATPGERRCPHCRSEACYHLEDRSEAEKG